MKSGNVYLYGMAFLGVIFASVLRAQPTAFVYQGRLSENGSLANGDYDLRFSIYDSAGGTNAVGSPITNSPTVLSNGLFTVTLDFGTGVFDGTARWLEIGAVTNGIRPFETLTPRQQIASTPYAMRALMIGSNALGGDYTGAVSFSNPSNSFTGTFAGDAAGLSNVNVSTLEGLAASDFWQLNGNSGIVSGVNFLGTTDNQPLELRVNQQLALQLVYPTLGTVPNLIGGHAGNLIGPGTEGAVIAGGSNNLITAESSYSTIAGGRDNAAAGNFAFAAGRRAKAIHTGTFVWSDSGDIDFESTSNDQFLVRASGGIGLGGNNTSMGFVEVQQPSDDIDHGVSVMNSSRSGMLRAWVDDSDNGHLDSGATGNADLVLNDGGGKVGIGTNNPAETLHVIGNIIASGTVAGSSDRNMKKNFAPVEPQEMLRRVASLPIQNWSYKAEDDAIHHVGPMAQDFHATFGLGANDLSIATVDADGVALAAIQGLNEKLEISTQQTELSMRILEEELNRTEAANAELRQQLVELKELVTSLTNKLNGNVE